MLPDQRCSSPESPRAVTRSNGSTLNSKQPHTAACARVRLRKHGRGELATSSSTLSWATTSHPRDCARALASCFVVSSVASDASIRYDVQKAEAYQACLATELQEHFIPLSQQELNVNVLCGRLEACMKSAAQNTMPQVCKRNCAHSRKHQPWYDSSCREALGLKEAVYKNPHSTAAEKDVAEKRFRSVTDRVKETWTPKAQC